MSQPSQPKNISVKNFVDDTAPLDSDGRTVICYEHWKRAKRLTSRTVTNPGRDFYACSKPHDDPDRCEFFIWADDRRLLLAMQSRSSITNTAVGQQQVTTPQRPSQARRAQLARSPATPISLQKRQRTPSPPPSMIVDGNTMTPKRGRMGTVDGTRTRPTTPALTPSQRAARQAEIERGIAEAQKLARLASIEEALSAARCSSQDNARSGSSLSTSIHPPQASASGSSRLKIIEAALQEHLSDVPSSSSPSSASQIRVIPRTLSRPPLSTQSDTGYSITSEVEEADLDDLEDKAVQTDPYDDEESIIEDFFNSPPSRSIIGSPVVYPCTVDDANADIGSGTSHASVSRVPASEPERGSWPSAPPPLTPGRGMRISTPGGNEGGMLLTPPGTSQTDCQFASQIGRLARQHGVAQSSSPSPAKGKGREMAHSASSSMSSSQWQMVQDDPDNPFHERAAPPRIDSPISIISGTEAFFESAGSFSGPLSADSIESQIASLASIPEYVRRLERRERAALNSADIKSRRIAQLEEEVQRLRNDNRALEDTIAALQVRR